jgi:hypothetical protein
MTPDLSLTYSSQSHSNDDVFGYGRQISLPYIERFNKAGLGDLYSTSTPSNNNNYSFYSSLSGELVAVLQDDNTFGGGMMSMALLPPELPSSASASGSIANLER